MRHGGLSLPHEGLVPYLVWGSWHSDPTWDGEGAVKEDRNDFPRAWYIGYGRNGERVSNVFFPPDKPGGEKILSDVEFIAEPWYNPAVGKAFPQFLVGECIKFLTCA